MVYSGLVSISFRKLTPEEIVKLVEKAGLDGIEWGGDIHVPHGDTVRAAEVAAMTKNAGLYVASYGSYYCVGGDDNKVPFEKVLETAVILGAPVIRVWAGKMASKDADDGYWKRVIEESAHIASMAERYGISVAYEYHANTLTDINDAALRLLKGVADGNMKSYWQPSINRDEETCLEEIHALKPWLSNVHVYYWKDHDRRPLDEGREIWQRYLKAVSSVPGDRFAMLEFVKDDSPEQFMKDAEALKQLLGK